jgi:Tfp pilus assembly protein PilN
MSATGQALYRINLIRERREKEKKAENQRNLIASLVLACFGLFIISIAYSGFTIWKMENILASEKAKLTILKQGYQKYKEAKLIVDKSDIELLSGLQGQNIIWTKKLVSIAKFLPDDYWITKFGYSNGELHLSGFGLIPQNQEQLITLEGYLNALRSDTSFADVFKSIRLSSATRTEDGGAKVRFDILASTLKKKAK